MFEILYEDNHIIVAEKPQNMIIAGDATGDESMHAALKEYVRVKYNKPGEAYLGLVHRLDRPAGGLAVFARTGNPQECIQIDERGNVFRLILQGRRGRKNTILIVNKTGMR